MASSFPRFRLYAQDGSTLVYDFEKVTEINDWQDPASFVEHSSLRSAGSIIIEGGNEPWDLNMSFVLIGTDYADLVSKISILQSTITKFTKYILKVELVDAGATKDYKVMRLVSFQFPLNNRKKRVDFQNVQITFRVGTWE